MFFQRAISSVKLLFFTPFSVCCEIKNAISLKTSQHVNHINMVKVLAVEVTSFLEYIYDLNIKSTGTAASSPGKVLKNQGKIF
jgi:hypothetical protein